MAVEVVAAPFLTLGQGYIAAEQQCIVRRWRATGQEHRRLPQHPSLMLAASHPLPATGHKGESS